MLNLPHDWSIESAFLENAPTGGGGGYLPTGIGWYRKHFTLRETELRKTVWIEFDGVYQNCDVWINGHHLGHYPNGYMSFYYELGGYLKKGENIIAVRVDNSLQPNTRYYSGSGIYRHVWLHVTDRLHVAPWGVYVSTPFIDSAVSRVAVRTNMVNDRKDAGRQGVLRTIVIDGMGHEVARADTGFSLAAGESAEIKQELPVARALLWSLERPEMYTVVSTVMRTADSVFTPFGFRDIRYEVDRGFFLNGKPVKMHGVCLHHDAGSVGAAVPDAVWARRLQVLKDMGCNAIRTSHNPVSPEFLGLCDRMGFLVMDEFLDEWKSGKVKYGYSQYFDEWSQHDLVGFIRRDRNHPSVIMWSAGNEIGEQKQEKGVDVLKALVETFHREDPTRPVTTGNDNIAADNGSARLPFLEALDIVGYNYVDRWHERRELFYDIDRHDHPHWKFVGTESVNIADVRGNYFGGNFFKTDSSVIRPANMPGVIRVEQLWKYVDAHDFVIGDFMWTGIDYLGEARWPSKNASSGVIDLCGFPKDAYYFYQSQWTQKPLIHLSPHWNWRGREGKVIQVMAYTNCDSVELFLNGRSFGIKALEFPRQGNSGAWNRYARPAVGVSTGDLHLIWDVPFEAGVLKAVGRKAGRVVCEEEVRTTGAPAAIRLSAERNGSISPDGRDVEQVKLEVVDEHGLLVPDADNAFQISIEGPATLLGLDNGDPKDHTSMKNNARKAFNGLALAIIRSVGSPGLIVVRALAPGLKEGVIEIGAGFPVGKERDNIPVMIGLKEDVPHLVARPQEILLWPGGAPGSEGKTGQEKMRIAEGGDHVISGIDKPSITPYLPGSSGGL